VSSAPADLLGFRTGVRSRTGLAAAEVGIVGDGAHARTGGYHEGRDVLVSIGRYHPPATAHVGDAGEDYSARKLRDRTGLSLSSSAVDIGSAWRQGHGVWLRFNVLLVAALHGGDPALAAVRAVNFTVDGATKHRTDREHGWAVEDSTDTVLTHTHVEFYRDTEGRRAQCLDRLLKLIDAAIAPPTAGGTVGQAEMLFNADAHAWAVRTGAHSEILPGNQPGTPQPFGNPLWDLLGGLVDGLKIVTDAVPGLTADVAAIRAGSGAVGLTDAQVAAITTGLATALGDRLTAIEDAVDKLMQAARAAGAAVG